MKSTGDLGGGRRRFVDGAHRSCWEWQQSPAG